MTLAAALKEPFAEQLAYFRQKLNLGTEHWDDILGNAHDRSFIVAGAMKADLLTDLRAAVDKAISQGTSLQEFRKDFAAIVQQHGWTDYKGEFGWRTKVIYETNMRASYAAGRYAQLTDPDMIAARPYWQYHHDDSVTHPRPLHVSWDGLVLRHDHPWWRTHFPPGGWGCRCYVTATSTREAERSGKREAPDDGTYRYTDRWGKVHELPRGIDYGWAHAPGATWQPDMRRYPPEIARGLRRDLESARDVPTRLSAPALRLALREAERQFSGEVEQASAFAPDGTLVLSKRGAFDSIEFTPAELSSLSGAVLTHSHPGVGSFSREDVALAAAYEVAEIRAVDEYFVYSLRTLGFSWDWHWWNRRAKPVVAQVRAEIDARLREARVTGKMTEEEFEAEYWHEIWQTVALQLNLRYRRKARR